ncbi:MAG TPA: lipopolysaccharide heptosyltransferase II [Smithellaceae bacterium]|nr:lipopolysaccharide heptosyltransferase II [Smithellaceae bacterium]HRS89415.1 lipopolysaccharide heptosyltransferase II [Smithellaceae bacterium]HRV26176.1 lipopolysaccharide heptosyltransferase II [Smithellaceae bacterium]
MNILIVKLSALGDVIHTLPSLAALRELYPDAHITWVVEEAAAGLLANHPLLDEVLISRRKAWITDIKAGQVRLAWQEIKVFIKNLRRRSYDLVIDFHGLFKSSLLVFLSRGKRKLGYDSWQELSGLFLNEKIPEDMTKHAVDRYFDFPLYLGAKKEKIEFILPQNVDAEKKVRRMLENYKLAEKKFIAINPIAYWETKLWDNQKFAELADMIQQQLGKKVVFTGSERASIDQIISKMVSDGINLGGQTSLPELAALFRKAKMVITTDSGPMHLACAVGTPVVALFGPTDPARTGPYGLGHTIVRANLPCSPCFLKKCPTTKCMKDITPEQIFLLVKEKLIGS